MRAIVSVSDKTGLVEFAKELIELGVEIYSTGGTKRALTDAGLSVHSVSELTGFPEILDGRVKTLHPAIHGGILARRDLSSHMDQLAENKILPLDMVVVNLYPFVKTVSRPGVALEEALENIDIGGPTMIRAAAKNFPHLLVIVDYADYEPVLNQMKKGEIGLSERRRLAQKAFQHVALYDTAIASYLRQGETDFPPQMTLALRKLYDLKYGENPHQKAAFYEEETLDQDETSITKAVQLGGKELSFNNILDLHSALEAVGDFEAPTVAIIKHNNPCGLSSHTSLVEAYKRALTGDPVAAFGGVVSTNQTLDLATAQEIDKTHYDAIIVPSYEPEALNLLRRKKDLRLVHLGLPQLKSTGEKAWDFRRVRGGLLAQTADVYTAEENSPRTATRRQPTEEEWRDLFFSWKAVKRIKSNAIVLAKDKVLLGMGAGQPSRVVSVDIALKKAGERSRGSVLGSDAFFPFADGIELAAKGGITAIIQPGGSVRDQEAIEMADKYNIAMVFTGVRHFLH
ncbi:bifunctional phosphoribosylaminoimidazolecarboxamide formyltransferase/IMP cyclohydrolase [Chloroflexota bacterium]